MLPNVVLYYSSDDVTDGSAWIYSHQEHDRQNFIGLSGKALFPTIRRLYMAWYESCDRLNEERAVDKFVKFFGNTTSEAEVRAVAEKYRDSIMLDDDALSKSIEFWTNLTNKYAKG